jgi:hypothetical protein
MTHKKIAMEHDKKIALVAHDNKKRDLLVPDYDVYRTRKIAGDE